MSADQGFDDILLELPLGYGSRGGPVWTTQVVKLVSGHEVRNSPHAGPMRRWEIISPPLAAGEASLLAHFFNARRGRLRGFRFADPFDQTSAAAGADITPFDEALGTGDGARTVFALRKTDGGIVRTITRPVASSVRIAVDGAETSAFTLDAATGRLTLETPPAAGTVVTAGFAFHVPVRFDTDALTMEPVGVGGRRLAPLPIIEVRERAA